jgi:hypothetical protein
VHVLEDQHEGRSLDHVLHELGHRLEKTPGAVLMRGGGRRGFAQLRDEPAELGTPEWAEPGEPGGIAGERAGPDRVDPWPERQHPVALVRATEPHRGSGRLGFAGQLAHEPCLADARLSHHDHTLPASAERPLERVAEAPHFFVAPDLGHPHDWRPRQRRFPVVPAPPCATAARGATRAQNLLIELARVGSGGNAEIPPQSQRARLVLPESRTEPPVPGVKPHDRDVRGLARGVERQQPEGGGECSVLGPDLELVGERLLTGVERHAPELLTLGQQPLVERRLAEVEPVEQVTAVEAAGRREGVGTAVSDEPSEAHHVHIDTVEVERDRVALDGQARELGLGQGGP